MTSGATGVDDLSLRAYARDYYRETVASETDYGELTGDVQADVCVIGGGLAGLSTALDLVRAGLSVVVLESEVVAWGASGRNGGAISPGFSNGFADIARRVGRDAAEALFRLSIDGVKIVEDNIEELKMDAVRSATGRLKVSRTAKARPSREAIDWMHRTFGYEMTFVPGAELKGMLSTEKYFHAIHDSHAFQIHPLNYALGLARGIEQHGGKLFEHSRAASVTEINGTKITKTARGQVRSQHVVFAGGGYMDPVAPALTASYVPIFTYVMVTKACPADIAKAVRTPCAVSDSRRSSDYYRLVDHGTRILWGGMISTREAHDDWAGNALRRRMVDTYPQLRSVAAERAWSGRMAYARHLMPQIGKMREGVWYCTAFGGHGLNTTAMGGRLIANAILNRSDEYRRFAPFGLAWNGSFVGKAAVQLTYWYLQLRDNIEEARDRAGRHA
jgi:gamma-glutamylputrescine oxidase